MGFSGCQTSYLTDGTDVGVPSKCANERVLGVFNSRNGQSTIWFELPILLLSICNLCIRKFTHGSKGLTKKRFPLTKEKRKRKRKRKLQRLSSVFSSQPKD